MQSIFTIDPGDEKDRAFLEAEFGGREISHRQIKSRLQNFPSELHQQLEIFQRTPKRLNQEELYRGAILADAL
jgi:hypothetical protein